MQEEINKLANKAIKEMQKAMSVKDIERIVLRQPDDVCKLMLIKLIRRSQ
jgi:hypothetical protein